MIAFLRRAAHYALDRTVVSRPYVCGDCPRIRRSLPAAIYREFVKTGVVRCRCGQPMTVVNHPAFGTYRPKVSS